ncbi:MAG: radical SAM protein, partial [Lachnospiraceae bacterium]|nr:radical SAM protein [Lachnospiraceae bacterium]
MNLELYIHIPFCLRKCGYCDFLSAPADEETREAYVQALCAEIAAAGADLPEKIPADAEVSSVYIGGGTPSILTGEQLFRIMTAVKKRFRLSEYAEVTCEVNPGAVDIGKLSRLRFAGVNRISIGLQSADDGFLRLLGRIHT